MNLQFDDQYQHGHSLVHQLDPRIKVILTVLFVLTASLTPFGDFGIFAALFAFVMLVALNTGVGVGYVLRRSVVALPFALAAITLPFTVPGEILATLPMLGGLTISLPGVIRFVTILLKSWISLQMAILLVAVTPVADILWALRALHLPQPLVAIVSFMYRYLFVLSDEVLRLLRARAARSGTRAGLRSGGSIVWRGQVAGRMAGSLMLRSFERSERIYNAMLARGYTGQISTLIRSHLRPIDFMALFTTLAFFCTLLFLAHLT